MTEQKEDGFTFPTLSAPATDVGLYFGKASKEPLTARSTVTDVSSKSQLGQPTPATSPVPVALEKGFSQVDWLKLTRSKADLAGTGMAGIRKDITLEEVAQHTSADDCWVVLRGKVFNVASYLKFHPGGVKILLTNAGKDVTLLFDMYHQWVNADALLAKCLVGFLVQPEAHSEAKPKPAPKQEGAEEVKEG